MVSSFSNPGFPPVHAHPIRLHAMDARLSAAIDSFEASMRAAIHEALDSARDAILKTVNPVLAEISHEIALIRRDLALSVEGDSDSKEAESIEVGHQKPQNGDSISLCIPSTIHDHSIPPLLSSSPLLRALATPVFKPQSNDSVATTVLLLGSKNVIHDSVMTTTPLLFPISATFSTESAHAHSHKLVLSTMEATTMAHVLEFPLKNAGTTESTGLSHTNTTKCLHEVLRSLISNLSRWKAKWHQLLQFLLAYHIGVIVVMYEDFLNDKFGWINWYLVGKFVKKDFHALELFDEMSKRERANVHVLSLMSYHMVKSIPSWHIFLAERKLEVMTCKALSDRSINLPALRITGGAPVIVALSSQDGTILSLIGIVSLEEWDAFNEVFRNCSSLLAMEATITVLKLMGLLMTNNGIVGSDRVVQAACAIVEAIETEVCELTLLNQKAAMVLQKLLSAAFSLNSSSQFCSDIRRKLENDFMISLQSVVREGGELLPIRPLPWYPENHADFSMLFTSNLDFHLVWDLGDASAEAVKPLLYKIERYKKNTSVEQLGCLAIQLRCSDFNLEIKNELNWSKEHNGVDIIVAMFLIVGTNVSIVQENSIPQHIADLARYMRMTMVSSVPAFPVITGKSYNTTKIAMKEMDIISTKLFLASESMCPALRWRSSQPDNHYKKLLASKSPDGPSNERKIVTLCKYAAKSPCRILKIAKSLEDRRYKELKLEHNNFINMVVLQVQLQDSLDRHAKTLMVVHVSSEEDSFSVPSVPYRLLREFTRLNLVLLVCCLFKQVFHF